MGGTCAEVLYRTCTDRQGGSYRYRGPDNSIRLETVRAKDGPVLPDRSRLPVSQLALNEDCHRDTIKRKSKPKARFRGDAALGVRQLGSVVMVHDGS